MVATKIQALGPKELEDCRLPRNLASSVVTGSQVWPGLGNHDVWNNLRLACRLPLGLDCEPGL